MKISQFREGSLGRFVNHVLGKPVYLRADCTPFGLAGVGGGWAEGCEEVGWLPMTSAKKLAGLKPAPFSFFLIDRRSAD
jgi:hypothetical protein